MSVTVSQLPDPIPYGTFLYCPCCGGRYSATRGDYFWMPPHEPFKCGECDMPLQLVRMTCQIVGV